MLYFKSLCLLIISLVLAGCEGGSGCSNSSSQAVDEYISFNVDFEDNNTLIYDNNEYPGGCNAQLITTRKTNSNYQPKMQEIIAEQHDYNSIQQHSVYFNSEFSRIYFINSSFIKFSASHTFHFWLKPIAEGYFASIGANGIEIIDNKIKITWGNEIKSLSADITMNTWQHIAIVDDAQDIKLIVNGVATSTLRVASTHKNTIKIGSDNFRGNIDKINFNTELLSTTTINTIYENTKSEYETLNSTSGY